MPEDYREIIGEGSVSLDYIRNFYKVPAEIGRIVKEKRTGRKGVITAAQGPYVLAEMYDNGKTCVFHPSDLEYLGMITDDEKSEEGRAV
jgi:hypothetical protein